MEVDVNKGTLVDLMEEVRDTVQDAVVSARTTNILLMAQALNLNVQDARQRNKALLHLELVEETARSKAS